MSRKKKQVISDESPVMNFISAKAAPAPEQEPEEEPEVTKTAQPEEAPEGFKPDYRYIEKRTKRVQLVLQPSLYEKLKAEADESGMSFNNFIHELLTAYSELPEE